MVIELQPGSNAASRHYQVGGIKASSRIISIGRIDVVNNLKVHTPKYTGIQILTFKTKTGVANALPLYRVPTCQRNGIALVRWNIVTA